jgi:hypothetical protein
MMQVRHRSAGLWAKTLMMRIVILQLIMKIREPRVCLVSITAFPPYRRARRAKERRLACAFACCIASRVPFYLNGKRPGVSWHFGPVCFFCILTRHTCTQATDARARRSVTASIRDRRLSRGQGMFGESRPWAPLWPSLVHGAAPAAVSVLVESIYSLLIGRGTTVAGPASLSRWLSAAIRRAATLQPATLNPRKALV